MDEMIWVYVGVISVILAFGIIFSNFKDFREESKINKIEWSLEKYKSDHKFVCKSAVGTRISVDLVIPAGTVLKAENDRICMNLDGDVRCVIAECDFDAPYTLDLNETMPDRSVPFHNYKCFLEKVVDHVKIECQG